MSLPIPMMNGEGLLECPFCSRADDVFVVDSTLFYVACGECESTSGHWCSRESAIRYWNTRAGHLFTEQDYKDMNEERKNDWS